MTPEFTFEPLSILYIGLNISVIEALKHACVANNCRPKLSWVNTDEIEKKGKEEEINLILRKIAEGTATAEETRRLVDLKRSSDAVWQANLPTSS